MRLLIRLRSIYQCAVPVNYNYPLSAAVYNLLRFGSPEFAGFLHDRGYNLNHKSYKLFSFALKFENAVIKNLSFILKSPYATLYISSPMIDTFIQNLVTGIFEKQTLSISDNNTSADFQVTEVENPPAIPITGEMKFSLLSPLVLSTKKIYNNKLQQYYLRPDDQEINQVLTQNLVNKYKLVYGKDIGNESLILEWDKGYLNTHNRVTKKVTIKKFGYNPVDVIGIQAPFTITGSPELIKIGYEAGFGEKNSMGFGMADTDYTN